MPNYEVDFSYKIQEWGTATLMADDKEHAEILALEYVRDNYTDAFGIEVEEVKEVNIG